MNPFEGIRQMFLTGGGTAGEHISDPQHDKLSGRLREDLIAQTMEVQNLSREAAIAYLGNIGLDGTKKKKKKKSRY